MGLLDQNIYARYSTPLAQQQMTNQPRFAPQVQQSPMQQTMQNAQMNPNGMRYGMPVSPVMPQAPQNSYLDYYRNYQAPPSTMGAMPANQGIDIVALRKQLADAQAAQAAAQQSLAEQQSAAQSAYDPYNLGGAGG